MIDVTNGADIDVGFVTLEDGGIRPGRVDEVQLTLGAVKSALGWAGGGAA